jgi:hypothetical protein
MSDHNNGLTLIAEAASEAMAMAGVFFDNEDEDDKQ